MKQYVLAILFCVVLVFFSNVIPRNDFVSLVLCFSILFGIYQGLLQNIRFKFLPVLIGFGILFRFVLLWRVPWLSDDYFRFVWDGCLVQQGLSPYSLLPSEVLVHEQQLCMNGLVIEQLNSPEYYSVYPPFLQLVFTAAVAIGGSLKGSLIVLKSVVFLFECVTIYTMYKLLEHWQMNQWNVLFYALNPLVIVELTGNLHFEAIAICFIVSAVYVLARYNSAAKSAGLIALAVLTKLNPLMLLPFLLWHIKRKQLWQAVLAFMGVLGIVCLFSFTTETFLNFFQSIQLYFGSFEFNAGLWYLVRSIGFGVYGWNIIGTASQVMSVITVVLLVILFFRHRKAPITKLFDAFLFAFSSYLLFSTIVHPWYITPLVAFSVFSRYRYALLWSYLAVFSYFAYSNPSGFESFTYIGVEYVVVFGYLLWEVFQINKVEIQ